MTVTYGATHPEEQPIDRRETRRLAREVRQLKRAHHAAHDPNSATN